MLKIKVPGTSANIGPGFDTLGVAIDIYNEYYIKKLDTNEKKVVWKSNVSSIDNKENYTYTTILKILNKYNKHNIGFELTMGSIDVPISRGLGSSASAIVAGIYAANYLLDDILTLEDIKLLATEFEGHPDNVIPAIIGGLSVSVYEDKKVYTSLINFPKDLEFIVMIPDFKLSTELARKVLPEKYYRKDCVFNISRVALLINSLNNKEYENLRIGINDKIHQNYRKELIKNCNKIFEVSKELGAYGEFISGAGPTLISIIDKKNTDFFHDMKEFLETLEEKWDIKKLQINNKGTLIEVIE
ncbi:homoserine kinase [Hypnocyclicus thermotrophus]|uniref:Homoserine kinase n=1 Tax=Hypnocyclicus thermotrophus TaxID=1627895 RepID=A0AA46E0H1_9FUSO|nr:homoserine kinase [Hypnocyclicus thermotrophus]TDT72223.1 homoserine kinase [Hypnocyclicus thermotrophus]